MAGLPRPVPLGPCPQELEYKLEALVLSTPLVLSLAIFTPLAAVHDSKV